jgi:Fe2+ transport system protein FeoA
MSATEMPAGAKARIERLLMDANEKRRLMDLGFCPGTVIERLLDAPFGGTTAFRVRGTVVAVRDGQTDQIEVTLCKN